MSGLYIHSRHIWGIEVLVGGEEGVEHSQFLRSLLGLTNRHGADYNACLASMQDR